MHAVSFGIIPRHNICWFCWSEWHLRRQYHCRCRVFYYLLYLCYNCYCWALHRTAFSDFPETYITYHTIQTLYACTLRMYFSVVLNTHPWLSRRGEIFLVWVRNLKVWTWTVLRRFTSNDNAAFRFVLFCSFAFYLRYNVKWSLIQFTINVRKNILLISGS